MSSRFVPGGTKTAGAEQDSKAGAEAASKGNDSADAAKKNPEWEAVQQELEAERKQREEKRVKAAQGEERSLYDILQANKGRSPMISTFPSSPRTECVRVPSRICALSF
jgi:hypothetical protein